MLLRAGSHYSVKACICTCILAYCGIIYGVVHCSVVGGGVVPSTSANLSIPMFNCHYVGISIWVIIDELSIVKNTLYNHSN